MRENKCILVMGASSDVGCALIRDIQEEYTMIYAHYGHLNEKLVNLKSNLGEKLVLIQADLTSEEQVDNLIQVIEEKKVYPDHVVHLPSMKTYNEKFHKYRYADLEIGWKISVSSIIKVLQKFMPHMMKNHYGKIIFMLTSCVVGKPPKYQSFYVMQKYALLGLMESLSVEYAGKGIMVNGISPDMMDTKFLEDIPEMIIQQNAMKNPLGRNLMVEDIVPAFEYLLSDGADAVTGMNLAITGGM